MGPLSGIRVLESSVWMVGPIAGMMLGDLGAEVIKIEPPKGGDPSRQAVRLWGVNFFRERNGRTVNLLFEACNRNKKSVTMDLKSPVGRGIAYRLIEKADVYLQNLRPGRAQLLGMDYETLRKINPRLVYATGSGYGPAGEDRMQPCQDTTGSARAGLMFAAFPEGPPTYLVGAFGDTMTGTLLAQAVAAALYARERTGQGQAVEGSLLGSLLWLHNLHVTINQITGEQFSRHDRDRAENPLMNWYRCGDEKWLGLGSFAADTYWPDYCKVLERPDLETNPKFADLDARRENCVELVALLDEIFATRPRDEWLRRLREAPSGIVCGPLNRISELGDDGQILANQYITNLQHRVLGDIRMAGIPTSYSETPGSIRATAPELGEHTDEVLGTVGGYGPKEIATFRERGVI